MPKAPSVKLRSAVTTPNGPGFGSTTIGAWRRASSGYWQTGASSPPSNSGREWSRRCGPTAWRRPWSSCCGKASPSTTSPPAAPPEMLRVIFTSDYEIHGNGEGAPQALMVDNTHRNLQLFDEFGARLTIMADVAEIERFG